MFARLARQDAGVARGGKRGSNAIEFALVSPILIMMVMGMADYGWFFWQEAIAANCLRDGVRAGGLKKQTTSEGAGVCAACTTQAQTVAGNELASASTAWSSYSGGSGLTATIVRIPSSGTPCTYAIELAPTISAQWLVGIIPGPSSFNVQVASMAQNLSCS